MNDLTKSIETSKRMTVKEVADVLGVSRQTIYRAMEGAGISDLSKNGQVTYLDESQVTAIKTNLRKNSEVARQSITDLEAAEMLLKSAEHFKARFEQEHKARVEAEQRLAVAEPKAAFFDQVADSKDAIQMRDVAAVYPRTIKKKPTRLYQTWLDMKQRCFNSNNCRWKYYGGKGVMVCPEWLEFDEFAKWALANGYADNLTIDRINSDGNYEPSNCQWVTRSENTIKAHLGRNHSISTKNLQSKVKMGAKSPVAKSCVCVETGRIFSTITEAGKSVGLTGDAITRVLKNKNRTAGGYTWAYI